MEGTGGVRGWPRLRPSLDYATAREQEVCVSPLAGVGVAKREGGRKGDTKVMKEGTATLLRSKIIRWCGNPGHGERASERASQPAISIRGMKRPGN